MNKGKRIFLVIIVVLLLITGCLPKDTQVIKPETLKLTKGSRIMIFQATGGRVSKEIKAFRLDVELPGIEFIDPPSADIRVIGLDKYIRDLSKADSVDRYFVIISNTKVEKQYNPVTVHKGYKNMPYRVRGPDGRFRYETRSEPVIVQTYQNACTRTSYQLSLYDHNGGSEGQLNIENPRPPKCPDHSDMDIHIDEVDYLNEWFKSTFTSQ